MIQRVEQAVDQEVLSLITDISFSQVPGWFGASYRDLKMSVICPKFVEGHKRLPVIVWFCGGAYLDVDKDVWLPQMVGLARRGFVIASPEYRTTNVAPCFPNILIDVKSAIRYLRAKADKYAIDPDRVYIMGESGGGTCATLASVYNGDERYDVGDYLEYSSDIQKVVDIYGLVEFEGFSDKASVAPDDDDPVARATVAFKDYFEEGSALRHISADTPPTLILHGSADELIPVQQSIDYYLRLQSFGIRSDLYIVEGAGHGDDMIYQEKFYDIIADFLNE